MKTNQEKRDLLRRYSEVSANIRKISALLESAIIERQEIKLKIRKTKTLTNWQRIAEKAAEKI